MTSRASTNFEENSAPTWPMTFGEAPIKTRTLVSNGANAKFALSPGKHPRWASALSTETQRGGGRERAERTSFIRWIDAFRVVLRESHKLVDARGTTELVSLSGDDPRAGGICFGPSHGTKRIAWKRVEIVACPEAAVLLRRHGPAIRLDIGE
jgi:hypothetical protein